MHLQKDSPFFSLPPEIRIRIQREYLKDHTELKLTSSLRRGEAGTPDEWHRAISVAPNLMLTCVKMYKEMRPMAFRDLTIQFPAASLKNLPLKMVLPPPREHLQTLTLNMVPPCPDLKAYRGLASHLLAAPSLKRFTLKEPSCPRWHTPHGDNWCFCDEISKAVERRGQTVTNAPQEPSPEERSIVEFTLELFHSLGGIDLDPQGLMFPDYRVETAPKGGHRNLAHGHWGRPYSILFE